MAGAHPYPYHVLDVFTTRRFEGNPLAVVLNADGMSAAAMQRIAAEFNLSETIFVMAPEAEDHEARVRIFTPRGEMPFAGHPTVGCAIFLAERHWPKGSIDEVLVLEEQAGLVPVRVRREAGQPIEATFTAPIIPEPRGEPLDRELAARALGLSPQDVREDHPVRAHAGGPQFLFVPLRDLDALGRAVVSEPHWSELLPADGLGAAFLYAPDGENAFRTRMFAPGEGIIEDPATGSASAILTSQLLAAGDLGAGTTELALTQGVEMGRTSYIRVAVEIADGSIISIKVSGSAVRVADGQVLA